MQLGSDEANVVSSGPIELGASARAGGVLSRGDATLRSNARVTGKLLTSGALLPQAGSSRRAALDHVYVAPDRGVGCRHSA